MIILFQNFNAKHGKFVLQQEFKLFRTSPAKSGRCPATGNCDSLQQRCTTPGDVGANVALQTATKSIGSGTSSDSCKLNFATNKLSAP